MSQPPIRVGNPDSPLEAGCGCCDGTELATLRPTGNRPNLTATAFRVGDHASFKASMLTGLASAAHPALAGLGTREDDDFTIANNVVAVAFHHCFSSQCLSEAMGHFDIRAIIKVFDI